MAYLNSNNIKVFPAARRTGSADPFSRLMSESTITSIINKFLNTEGFVITDSTGTISSGAFEFNIYGYYIKVEHVEDLISQFSSANKIYAAIYLDSSQTGVNNLRYTQLVGVDNGGSYNGVNFGSQVPADEANKEKHFLLILDKSSGNWKIPSESRIKFNQTGLIIEAIDGGEI